MSTTYVTFTAGHLEGRVGLIVQESKEWGLRVNVFSKLHPDEVEQQVWVSPRMVAAIEEPNE